MKKLDVEILGNNKNIGLAGALNLIFQQAYKDGYDWVLTLDQDSIVQQNMIDEFKKIYKKYNNRNIAIICPRFIDKRREESKFEKNFDSEVSFIDVCITSASMTNIKCWKKVGKFDEKLFIDLIDNDFCKRIALNNLKIMRLNNFVLDQQKGEIVRKSKFKVSFYMFFANIIKPFNNNVAKNFSKLVYKKTVVPMRVYYTNRNIIYLNKKYKNYGGIGHFGYINYNCNSYFGFNICFNLPSILRGKNKIEILKSISNGIKDGKKLEYEIYDINKN